ncbi:MAG: Asp-tRNA(Asn)/Glu-tRNA(Gln) amidotransferase subunit GatB [Clostridiaceae bacterium]|jgi:aspartyl-tRNA(Asn)/glutamyl-tRNA(Gln) amidotransferase subunit B|nr:Asp-tRNA(Asn)/Glu-tRNA(Gln) amidotransferase subunit GatB [Clostridiaceae bacterium]
MKYETVVGLEIHTELSTKTKMYCGCATTFGSAPNSNCCPGCLAMPGTLPVLNKTAVRYAIAAGLAMNCEISAWGKQDRKNYFYPDLPKAYQDSQLDTPLCKNGYIDITVDNTIKRIRINRIHIEEDAGKLLHDSISGDTLIDLNRGSLPLIEIVTEPDISSAEEAKLFLESVKAILEYTEVSDCKMEQGSLRCDVNVSIRPEGETKLGTRCEMKNINSFRAAFRAIEFESMRQKKELEFGGKLVQETRRWDDVKGESTSMRNKETAMDYRYFPDPDLVYIAIDDDFIDDVKRSLPELPAARKTRYMEQYNISSYDAEQITNSKQYAEFFEGCLAEGATPKAVCNWILGDIARILNEKNMSPGDIPFSHIQLAKLIGLIEDGIISNTAGKTVLSELFENPRNPEDIVSEKGLAQISDEGQLTKAICEVIAANPKSVEDYKAGKDKAIGFLIGQTMRATKGKGNPELINKLLKTELDK